MMIQKYLKLKITTIFVLILVFNSYAQHPTTMITVEGGKFTMGKDNIIDPKEDADEAPAHEVTVKTFEIGECEVTVGQYKEFVAQTGKKMPADPDAAWLNSHEDTKKFYPTISNSFWGWKDNLPMNHVSWFDATEYCNWLSEKMGLEKVYSTNEDGGVDTDLSKNGYRLPTEAEWEFAARGGNKSKGYNFSGSKNPSEVGWYDETTKVSGPRKVKQKQPNELGIYDMSGNVWEWCSDFYAKYYYATSPKVNPFNSTTASYRVLRGGGWHYKVDYATVTSRDGPQMAFTNYNYGFRLAKTK